MAVFLTDALKNERDPLRLGVLNTLLLRANIMQLMPFETIGRLAIRVSRWKALPSVAFRQLNAAYAESTGTTEFIEETVYDLGGDVDTDVLIDADQSQITPQRGLQREMKAMAMAYQFNDSSINGDQSVDVNSFTGIKKRISNLPSTQLVATATNGLDVRNSDANMHAFLDKIDQAAYEVIGGLGEIGAILCNQTSFLGLQGVLRRRGTWTQTRDYLGKIAYTYGEGGPRIIDVGVKADQSTKIITDLETQGSSTDCTSIYFLRFGQVGGEYLHGIQEFDLRARDLGELETKPVLRDRFQWPVGLFLAHDKAISRLQGVRWFT